MDNFDQRLSDHYGEEYQRVFRLRDWMMRATNDDGKQTQSASLLLFALQSGLARLWQSWGIEPDAVFGFGVGQYTAACVAGGLSFCDALMLVVHREAALRELGLFTEQRRASHRSTRDSLIRTKPRHSIDSKHWPTHSTTIRRICNWFAASVVRPLPCIGRLAAATGGDT